MAFLQIILIISKIKYLFVFEMQQTLQSSRYPLLLQAHLKLQKHSLNLKRIIYIHRMHNDATRSFSERSHETKRDSNVDCQMVFSRFLSQQKSHLHNPKKK